MKDFVMVILKFFLKVLLGLLLTVSLFGIYALLLFYTSVEEDYIKGSILAASFVGTAFGGFLNGRGKKNHGWFHGSLVGVFFSAVVFLLNRLFGENPENTQMTGYIITFLLITVASGAIGGVIGINAFKVSKS